MKYRYSLIICLFLFVSWAQASENIDGPLKGNLQPGTYHFSNDFVVAAGDTLRIIPPCDLYFNNNSAFVINGRLTAIGTAQDSIRFLSEMTTWEGLQFSQAQGRNRLAYCRISQSHNAGIICQDSELDLSHVEFSNNNGGYGGPALTGDNSNVSFSDCLIRENFNQRAMYGSGGVLVKFSTAMFENCRFENNVAGGIGQAGALYCRETELSLENCQFIDNLSLDNGNGGGMYLLGCSAPQVRQCLFSGNQTGSGGGINIFDCTTVLVEDCIFTGNTAVASGGIRCSKTDLTVNRCLISHNVCNFIWGGSGWGCGVLAENGSRLTLLYSTIVDNLSYPFLDEPTYGNGVFFNGFHDEEMLSLVIRGTVFADNQGLGGGAVFTCGSSFTADISYNDFWNNEGGSFTGNIPDPALGVISGVNNNGDPCDDFSNIFSGPLFQDQAGLNYNLTSGSPCIDAGDPADPVDPDGTLADLGRYWFTQVSGVLPGGMGGLVRMSAAPNPFNPRVCIAYDLPQATRVSLTIHDVAGKKVQTLLTGLRDAGHHEVVWDGRDAGGRQVPSGIYFYRLAGLDCSGGGKITLLK